MVPAQDERIMNLTTTVYSRTACWDFSLLCWFALLPFAVYLPTGLDGFVYGLPADITTFEAFWLLALFNSVPGWFLLSTGHYFERWLRISVWGLMSVLTILVHVGNDPLSDPDARLRFLLAPLHICLLGGLVLLLWSQGRDVLQHGCDGPR
jgi:hypothetical protein